MSELRGVVNTEHELKLVTDHVGLDRTRVWARTKGLCNEGAVWFDRSHIFYDSDSFDLLSNGWAYRQKTHAFSYCLKYPVNNRGSLLVRREIFIRKLPFALDFRNLLHRRTPVMAPVVDLIRRRHTAADDTLHSIRPRVKVDCLREYFYSISPGTSDRSIGIALDVVKAIDLETGAAVHEWCEVELETGWGFVDDTDLMVSYAAELSSQGLKPTTDTKYEIAARAADLGWSREA